MKNKLYLIGALVVFLLAIAVTWTYAQSEIMTYYACVNNGSGTIHIIGADEDCGNNEERIVWNNQGPPGPKGDKGDQGDPGAPGILGFYHKFDTLNILPVSTVPIPVAKTTICDSGDFATGGGYTYDPTYADVRILGSHQAGGGPNPSGWTIIAENPSEYQEVLLYVYVVCADMTPGQP